MTTSVIYCLSYDLSKELFIAIKVYEGRSISNKTRVTAPCRKSDLNVVTGVVMTLLVPAKVLIQV